MGGSTSVRADVERLTRRLRSVSQRLEGIEDGVDRLDERLGSLSVVTGIEARLASIDESLRRSAASGRPARGDARRRRPCRASRSASTSERRPQARSRARKAKAAFLRG